MMISLSAADPLNLQVSSARPRLPSLRPIACSIVTVADCGHEGKELKYLIEMSTAINAGTSCLLRRHVPPGAHLSE